MSIMVMCDELCGCSLNGIYVCCDPSQVMIIMMSMAACFDVKKVHLYLTNPCIFLQTLNMPF